MSTIAIITARGGSKRIPQKNIKEFCGKPIIAYSILAAIKSGIFDEVMVSTDSNEIASIAIEYGAKVPFLRSDITSNDFATTEDVLLEVIEKYEKKGRVFDMVCCIYPTAPFVTSDKLINAYQLLSKFQNANSLASVVQYGFPPQRAFIMRDEKIKYQYPEYMSTRSQDLEPIYHDCGQFYFCKCSALKQYKNLITPDTIPFILPEEEVQDIDNPSDWVIAELKYSILNNKE